MPWLALALSLAQTGPSAPPAPPWFGGRVLTRHGLHVGVRPAAFLDDEAPGLEGGVGVTVQLTVSVL